MGGVVDHAKLNGRVHGDVEFLPVASVLDFHLIAMSAQVKAVAIGGGYCGVVVITIDSSCNLVHVCKQNYY